MKKQIEQSEITSATGFPISAKEPESLSNLMMNIPDHICQCGACLKMFPSKEDKITRVEIIDDTGRVYSKWGVSIELDFQDQGRTLKVFVKNLKSR